MASLYLVCDYCHSGIIEVQPGWNLPIGDNENVPNPRCVPLDRSQRVPQLFIIFKTAGRNIFILLRLRKAWGTEKYKIPLSHTAPPDCPLCAQGTPANFQRLHPAFKLKKKKRKTLSIFKTTQKQHFFHTPF